MDAKEAKQLTETAKIEYSSENDEKLTQLEEWISQRVREQHGLIDLEIAQAASNRKSHVSFDYDERISARRNSTATITYIESVADIVTSRLSDVLTNDGFMISITTGEAPDFRDSPQDPPEYYINHLSIDW